MANLRQKSINDPIPADLFGILACPLCKAGLEYTKGKKELMCPNCNAKYPIREGIPVLLPKSQK